MTKIGKTRDYDKTVNSYIFYEYIVQNFTKLHRKYNYNTFKDGRKE